MLRSCSTEYTSTVLRRSLARYMAMSALWRSSATSSPCSGASAMPALAVTASVSPSISIGRDSSALSSLTMAIARSASVTSAITRANSSPPRRATVACSPTARSSRSDTSQSSRSPIAWPSVSLTSLKRSRSSRTMATPPLSLMAVVARLRNSMRLGSPVSMSCVAWWDLLSTSNRSSSTRRARSRLALACATSASKRRRSSSSKPSSSSSRSRATMAPIAVFSFMSGATMAWTVSPGDRVVAAAVAAACTAVKGRMPLSIAWVTNDDSLRLIGSTPEGP